MPTIDAEVIHTALVDIKQNGPFDDRVGICVNLEHNIAKLDNRTHLRADDFEVLDQMLATKFQIWPEFSGLIEYPINGVGDQTDNTTTRPVTEYWSALKNNCMWVGEYGASRLRLLDFLIVEFKKDIDNERQTEHAIFVESSDQDQSGWAV